MKHSVLQSQRISKNVAALNTSASTGLFIKRPIYNDTKDILLFEQRKRESDLVPTNATKRDMLVSNIELVLEISNRANPRLRDQSSGHCKSQSTLQQRQRFRSDNI